MAALLQPQQSLPIQTTNDSDYVHDMAFDYYGTRLAVCTSSLKIIIYGLSDEVAADTSAQGPGGESSDKVWEEIATINTRNKTGHTGPIWRLSWGGPEHGDPLASCSEDRSVLIWQDRGIRRVNGRAGGPPTVNFGQQAQGWELCATLTCEGPVVDVRFAPSLFGLKVAACTAHGRVKVFECNGGDVKGGWDTNGEDVEPLQRGLGFSQSFGASAAAASDSAGAGEQLGAAMDWLSPPFGAGAAADDRESLAVVHGGRLSMYTRRGGQWAELCQAAKGDLLRDAKDLAWCPNLCRPYELIATVAAAVALWRVTLDGDASGGRSGAPQISMLQLLAGVDPEGDMFWRCSWNLTGTSLALCQEGGEGFVSVWKASTVGEEWRQECEIGTDVDA